ncbi:hypothetical protein BZG36_00148 [Bifiguratus adelaidae]|uniref:Phosphorylase kinase alphabeta n=1 Tax=Bifiguratus adelaidae TaxID=1938954 RepID=A0A261Y886_9FUNG|nr:hypothetical protein BZG36_00148 [Bifiguratus adelaidae]
MSYVRAQQQHRERLDYYYRAINTIILSRQNPVTGLIPASVAVTTHGDYRDAWVRDNVYSIMAVFGLALAYRRVDDNDGRAYELEHAVVKLMRGLLFCMMRQSSKVENFKKTQSLEHSLHAKYNTSTGDTVVGDFEWGHLQIDATSIFLLALAQMTTTGLQIVYTMDEVDFVQNLIFYIERAYRTPDYGIWERGNKTNHGQPELNSSSIGMAVAALQAINGVNLFGSKGGNSSVIHVLPDELTRNSTTLHSFLPRESNSKEVDAALLSVIGFPAFAVKDPELARFTQSQIITKLGGKYGCKRFLRDGHQTVVEDTSRLHYNANELMVFENIESEWPLFFTYMILNGLFSGDEQQVEDYRHALEPLIIDSATLTDFGALLGGSMHDEPTTPTALESRIGPSTPGKSGTVTPFGGVPLSPGGMSLQDQHIQLIPELYYVPEDKVEAERQNPHSQPRVANDNVPLVWANSLFFLGNLIYENLLSVAEIDPLGRRYNATSKTELDTVIQITLLAEDVNLQSTLSMYGLETQTPDQVLPATVLHPDALKEVYAGLGLNNKLELSGRPKRRIGSLGTCRLYRVGGQIYAFTPNFMDNEEFYLTSDNDYLISIFENELQFIRQNWFYPGRPTLVILLTHSMLGGLTASHRSKRDTTVEQPIGANDPGNRRHSTGDTGTWRRRSSLSGSNSPGKKNLLNWFMNLRSGNINGVRVRLGRLMELVPTSNIDSLDFLIDKPDIDWETILKVTSSRGRRRKRSGRKLGFNEKQTQASTPGPWYNSTSASGAKTPGVGAGRKALKRSASHSRSKTEDYFSRDEMGDEPDATVELKARFKLKDHDEMGRSPSPFGNARRTNLGGSPVLPDSDSEKNETANVVVPQSQAANANGTANDEGAGTSPASGDMLALVLGDPSMTGPAIQALSASVNLYDQIDLLQYLQSCHGSSYYVDELDAPLKQLLEEVYYKSLGLRLWSIVRQAAGLLRKVVPSLTVNITDLVIRQKQITIGFGDREYFISTPVGPDVLSSMIWEHSADDIREAPLVQELIIYLGSFMRAHPTMFDGILRLRIHFIIVALREEIARLNECGSEEAMEHLMHLSPFELKSLLGTILSGPSLCDTDVSTVVRERSIDHRFGQPGSMNVRGRGITFASGLSGEGETFTPVRLSTLSRQNSSSDLLPNRMSEADARQQVVITAQSGGYLSGNFARIEVNGHVVSVGNRGLNVVVIDPVMNMIVERVSFDTHISEDEADDFARFVDWLDHGVIVVCCTKDDCMEHMSDAGIAALQSLGSKYIGSKVGYRDSWCMIGQKDAEHGPVPEAHKVANDGPTDVISRTIDATPQKKEGDGPVDSTSITAFVPNSSGRWLRRRKNDGALNRMPQDFYPKTWKILERAHGFVIHDHFLGRDPTVLEKTPEEFSFALLLEGFLGWFADPAERQIAVETLTVISRIQDRTPEMNMLNETIDITKIMNNAIESFWKRWVEDNKHQWAGSENLQGEEISYPRNEATARQMFFDLPQDGRDGTFNYLGRSALKILPFDIDYRSCNPS